jgi:hypothetical protein
LKTNKLGFNVGVCDSLLRATRLVWKIVMSLISKSGHGIIKQFESAQQSNLLPHNHFFYLSLQWLAPFCANSSRFILFAFDCL